MNKNSRNSVGRNPFEQASEAKSESPEDLDLLSMWKNHPLKNKKVETLQDILQHRDEITQFTKKTLRVLAKKVARDYIEPNQGYAPKGLRKPLKKILKGISSL